MGLSVAVCFYHVVNMHSSASNISGLKKNYGVDSVRLPKSKRRIFPEP
jgi:hypothetical protein